MEKGVHEQGAEENIWTYQREDVTGHCKKTAQWGISWLGPFTEHYYDDGTGAAKSIQFWWQMHETFWFNNL